MAQHILPVLAGLIGHVREGAEGRHVNKIILVHLSQIAEILHALRHVSVRRPHVFGQTQAVGKIIGASRRNVAKGSGKSAPLHSRHHFVQGTVPAAAHKQVVSSAFLFHYPGRILGFPGGTDHNLVIIFCQFLQNVRELAADRSFSGPWIINKQHPFHTTILLYVSNISIILSLHIFLYNIISTHLRVF